MDQLEFHQILMKKQLDNEKENKFAIFTSNFDNSSYEMLKLKLQLQFRIVLCGIYVGHRIFFYHLVCFDLDDLPNYTPFAMVV